MSEFPEKSVDNQSSADQEHTPKNQQQAEIEQAISQAEPSNSSPPDQLLPTKKPKLVPYIILRSIEEE